MLSSYKVGIHKSAKIADIAPLIILYVDKQAFDHQGVCSSTNYSSEHRSSCNLYTKSAVEQLQLEVLQPFNNLLDLLRSVYNIITILV